MFDMDFNTTIDFDIILKIIHWIIDIGLAIIFGILLYKFKKSKVKNGGVFGILQTIIEIPKSVNRILEYLEKSENINVGLSAKIVLDRIEANWRKIENKIIKEILIVKKGDIYSPIENTEIDIIINRIIDDIKKLPEIILIELSSNEYISINVLNNFETDIMFNQSHRCHIHNLINNIIDTIKKDGGFDTIQERLDNIIKDYYYDLLYIFVQKYNINRPIGKFERQGNF
jgi:hypothetical protein